MLPDQSVSITVTNKNLNRYRSLLNNDNIMSGDNIDVPVVMLPKYANHDVDVICDYCGERFTKKLSNRNISIDKGVVKKDCCNSCRLLKVKESNLITYGYESHLSNKTMREKVKAGMIEKYGVEHPMHSEELLKKMIQTCIERDGKDYLAKRIKKGHDRLESEYGDPYYSWKLQSSIDKRRATCIDRYGVENVIYLDEYVEKIRKTNFEKYGVSSAMRVPEIARKSVENRGPYLPRTYTGPSGPQHKMYELLLNSGYDVYEDYPFLSYYLDCAVFIGEHKLDIEYDGRYWHPLDSERDRIRNNYVIKEGWNVIRFRGNNEIPSIEQLNTAINIAINENQPLQVIELAG